MIADRVLNVIKEALKELNFSFVEDIPIEHPNLLMHGDFSTNIAMRLSVLTGKNSQNIAQEIKGRLEENNLFERVEVAGGGFINMYLAKEEILNFVITSANDNTDFDIEKSEIGKKVMVEYTDPNPFKVFHIGHLMTNVIGESIARLYEKAGAKVVRANYQGDVGPHVARALWGMMNSGIDLPDDASDLTVKTEYLGDMYVLGKRKGDEDEKVAEEVKEINRAIYEKDNEKINELYKKGRRWSLEHFEVLYKKLGTRFDRYYFESEVWEKGVEVVIEQQSNGIFEKSEGAVVFKGEDFGLHTRPFISSSGLPLYEAKEMGVNIQKFEDEPDLDKSIIITANEQSAYFQVILKALEQFRPDITEKTQHLAHGMMREPGNKKMSSRFGNVISGEGLLNEIEEMVREKMRGDNTHSNLIIDVAVSAVKYMILKQQLGKNIIFDREQALSFEGDSGPYLQYTNARCNSLLDKGKEVGMEIVKKMPDDWELTELERLLYRYPEIIKMAIDNLQSHRVVNYLIALARAFNSFYGGTQIIDEDIQSSGFRLLLVKAVSNIISDGLNILGIRAPKKM